MMSVAQRFVLSTQDTFCLQLVCGKNRSDFLANLKFTYLMTSVAQRFALSTLNVYCRDESSLKYGDIGDEVTSAKPTM